LINRNKKFRDNNWNPIVLNNTNISKYINIDEYPLNYNKLIVQHKADWIRLKVLQKYGGLWMDASIIINDMDKLEEMYKLPIFLETAHNTILNLEKNFCNIFSNNSYNKMMTNKLTYNHTIIDLILYNRYFNNVMNGVCIDIGVGNGSTNNYSYYFNKRLNWHCINIEPLSNMHNQLCSNRYFLHSPYSFLTLLKKEKVSISS
jgi:hypothetical protein